MFNNWIGIILVTAVVAACSNSHEVEFRSALEPDRPLNELTDAEAMQLCDSVLDLIPRVVGNPAFIEGQCTEIAAIFSEDEATCRQIRDECIAEAEDEDFSLSAEERAEACEDLQSDLADAECEATTSDLERCVNLAVDYLLVRSSAASCPESSEGPAPPVELLACEQTLEACDIDLLEYDGAFGGSTSDSGTSIDEHSTP